MVYKVEAVEREATGEGWPFEFDGDRYELPNDFDMRVAAMLSGGDLHGALAMLLGDEQWERLNASPKIFGLKALGELLQAWTNDIGVDLGEFTAPPPSSARKTVAPSKRTSNGSTASRSRTSSRSRSG